MSAILENGMASGSEGPGKVPDIANLHIVYGSWLKGGLGRYVWIQGPADISFHHMSSMQPASQIIESYVQMAHIYAYIYLGAYIHIGCSIRDIVFSKYCLLILIGCLDVHIVRHI